MNERNEGSGSSGGLIKNLLFPAYADSGSNDTFRPKSSTTPTRGKGMIQQQQQQQHSTPQRHPIQQQQQQQLRSPAPPDPTGMFNNSTYSRSVVHNPSSPYRPAKQQQHQNQQQHLQKQTGIQQQHPFPPRQHHHHQHQKQRSVQYDTINSSNINHRPTVALSSMTIEGGEGMIDQSMINHTGKSLDESNSSTNDDDDNDETVMNYSNPATGSVSMMTTASSGVVSSVLGGMMFLEDDNEKKNDVSSVVNGKADTADEFKDSKSEDNETNESEIHHHGDGEINSVIGTIGNDEVDVNNDSGVNNNPPPQPVVGSSTCSSSKRSTKNTDAVNNDDDDDKNENDLSEQQGVAKTKDTVTPLTAENLLNEKRNRAEKGESLLLKRLNFTTPHAKSNLNDDEEEGDDDDKSETNLSMVSVMGSDDGVSDETRMMRRLEEVTSMEALQEEEDEDDNDDGEDQQHESTAPVAELNDKDEESNFNNFKDGDNVDGVLDATRENKAGAIATTSLHLQSDCETKGISLSMSLTSSKDASEVEALSLPTLNEDEFVDDQEEEDSDNSFVSESLQENGANLPLQSNNGNFNENLYDDYEDTIDYGVSTSSSLKPQQLEAPSEIKTVITSNVSSDELGTLLRIESSGATRNENINSNSSNAPRTPKRNNASNTAFSSYSRPPLSPRPATTSLSPRTPSAPIQENAPIIQTAQGLQQQQQEKTSISFSFMPRSPKIVRHHRRHHSDTSVSDDGTGGTLKLALPSPFRIAKKCFSYDTSIHDDKQMPYCPDDTGAIDGGEIGDGDHEGMRQINLLPSPPQGGGRLWGRGAKIHPATVGLDADDAILDNQQLHQQQQRKQQQLQVPIPLKPDSRGLWHSYSWDVGGDYNRQHELGGQQYPLKYSLTKNSLATTGEKQHLPRGISTAAAGGAFRTNGNKWSTRMGSAGRLSKRSLSSGANNNALQQADNSTDMIGRQILQAGNSQRVDVEREDALDILSCLVERSFAFQQESDETCMQENRAKEEEIARKSTSPSSDRSVSVIKPGGLKRQCSGTHKAIDAIRVISEHYERLVDDPKSVDGISVTDWKDAVTASVDSIDHTSRMEVLDELMRSHTYALEMNRAALSASAWLKSIGRLGSSTDLPDNKMIETSQPNNPANDTVSKSPVDLSKSQNEIGINSKDIAYSSDMDIVSMRAILHATELNAAEKAGQVERLNVELSKCRAEIGRLQNTSRAEAMLTSVNKSILDDEDDETTSSSEPSIGTESEFILDGSLGDITPIPNDTSDLIIDPDEKTHSNDQEEKVRESLVAAEEARKEVVLLKAALEKANFTIANLTNKANCQVDLSKKKHSLSDEKTKDSNESKEAENPTNESDPVTEQEQLLADDKDNSMKSDVTFGTDQPGNVNNYTESNTKSTPEAQLDGSSFSCEDVSENSPRMESVDLASAIDISHVSLEKELEEYREAIRDVDKKEIQSLKLKLKEAETKSNRIVEQTGKNGFQLDSPSNNEERMINVRMLDGENFVTEWDELTPPLPPPPDHGLRSPIVDALLCQWTTDKKMHASLLSWIEQILNGEDAGKIPPLQISSLDHQVRDGFTMHILPLLLRRSDVHVEVTTRVHRKTTYDLAVSVAPSELAHSGSVEFGNPYLPNESSGKKQNSFPGSQGNLGSISEHESVHPTKMSQRSASGVHMMAFRASRSGKALVEKTELEDSMSPQQNLPETNMPYIQNKVSNLWRSNENKQSSEVGSASVAASSITTLTSNRTPHGISGLDYVNTEQHSSTNQYASDQYVHFRENPSGLAVSSIGDDHSVGSNITGASVNKSNQSAGIMGAIGGAFGGLLSRRKMAPQLSPSQSKSEQEEHEWNESLPQQNSWQEPSNQTNRRIGTPNYQPVETNTAGKSRSLPQSPRSSQVLPSIPSSPPNNNVLNPNSPISAQFGCEEDQQPYQRVVSAPPGRIGVTFVQYRGHAMVSDVYPESPLSGWVFPSDILIAIDEVPVSGLRVREIVKLLTARKERQRALRMISTHAMSELTQTESL